MRIFWIRKKKKKKKNYRELNRFSVGGPPLKPLFASGGWGLSHQTLTLLLPPTITALSSSFLVLNVFYYPKKKNKITTVNMFCFCFFRTFHLLLTSNSAVFVDRGSKNISCPRTQGTLATPLLNGIASRVVRQMAAWLEDREVSFAVSWFKYTLTNKWVPKSNIILIYNQ